VTRGTAHRTTVRELPSAAIHPSIGRAHRTWFGFPEFVMTVPVPDAITEMVGYFLERERTSTMDDAHHKR